MEPDKSPEPRPRPSLRLLDPPAQLPLLTVSGRRWHPATRTRGDGPLLYICGDHEGRIVFTHIARRWATMRLVVADGGRTGLQVATRRRPRLVVVDGHLPDVDGVALVKHLRQRALPAESPVIVLGHDADPRERARFVWSGASAYLTKPLNVAEIDRTVMVLLELAALR